jgi:mono/diheme cytochrome c family protein
MSSPTQKPDLEESINVTEAHARVVGTAAAAAREKRLASNGMEPVSLWIFVACALVLLIAGGILGGGGRFFDYDATFQEGYVRATPPGAASAGPELKEALVAFSNRGARQYAVKCNGCHLVDARGDGANYPSLVGSEWVIGDTQRLAMVILNGLQGPTSTGRVYGAGVMPAQGSGMTPEDLAGLMTHLRNHFGNSTGDIVTVEMARAAMEISAARGNAGQSVTGVELEADHSKALPGEPLDPDTMVNPANLTPAGDSVP